jgi:hypothetical protein
LDDLTLRNTFSPIAKIVHALELAPQSATLAQVNELTSTLQHQRFSRLKPIAESAQRLLKLFSPDRTLTELPQPLVEQLILHPNEFSSASELSEVLHTKFSRLLHQLQTQLPQQTAHSSLIQRYLKVLPAFLRDGSHHFISESPENFAQSMQWIQHGGLVHDPAIGRLALHLRHKLPENHRQYLAPKTSLTELGTLKSYSQNLLQQIARQMHEPGQQLADVLWQSFRHNRRFQYMNYALGLGGSMLGLGVLVPKLQIALNHRLTGRSDHPGLAAMVEHG